LNLWSVLSGLKVDTEFNNFITTFLAPFFASNQVEGIRTTLLDLRTPHRYLDLHIGLVYAFDQIEQGRLESDQAKIEAGFEQIHGLADQNEWIR